MLFCGVLHLFFWAGAKLCDVSGSLVPDLLFLNGDIPILLKPFLITPYDLQHSSQALLNTLMKLPLDGYLLTCEIMET